MYLSQICTRENATAYRFLCETESKKHVSVLVSIREGNLYQALLVTIDDNSTDGSNLGVCKKVRGNDPI